MEQTLDLRGLCSKSTVDAVHSTVVAQDRRQRRDIPIVKQRHNKKGDIGGVVSRYRAACRRDTKENITIRVIEGAPAG